MRAVAGVVFAAVASLAVTFAGAPATKLPPPSFSFTASGSLSGLAAAGARVALAMGCDVRVIDLVRGSKPVRVRPVGDCRSDPFDSGVIDLHLGRATLVATMILAPSPHGESYTLWGGPLPGGPLRALGDAWGWTDSDVPAGWGCAWTIAAGGGVVALAQIPNRLAVDQGLADEPTCPAAASARITLKGAPRTALTVPGSWAILATDGKRLALAQLDDGALPTGQLSLVDLKGKKLPTPRVAAATVRAASDGWLTPPGLILRTSRGISGPGWTIKGLGGYPEAAVAEGRLLYLKRRTIRVRRLRDGVDRALLRLPSSSARLAAGSFGLVIAIGTEANTSLYRLPWRTIDRTLPRASRP